MTHRTKLKIYVYSANVSSQTGTIHFPPVCYFHGKDLNKKMLIQFIVGLHVRTTCDERMQLDKVTINKRL